MMCKVFALPEAVHQVVDHTEAATLREALLDDGVHGDRSALARRARTAACTGRPECDRAAVGRILQRRTVNHMQGDDVLLVFEARTRQRHVIEGTPIP